MKSDLHNCITLIHNFWAHRKLCRVPDPLALDICQISFALAGGALLFGDNWKHLLCWSRIIPPPGKTRAAFNFQNYREGKAAINYEIAAVTQSERWKWSGIPLHAVFINYNRTRIMLSNIQITSALHATDPFPSLYLKLDWTMWWQIHDTNVINS